MIFNSVADIYAANDEAHRRLVARVEGLNPAQQNFRPAADAWSVAEIVEHLSMIDQQMVALVGKLLKKVESDAAATAASPSAASRAFVPFSMDALVAPLREQKLTAPESVRPHSHASVADALATMRQARAALRAFQTRLEAADLSAATFPHTFLGALDLAQWLAFIGLHKARHVRQIEKLIASPEFKVSDERGAMND